jgi:hypothetical protein
MFEDIFDEDMEVMSAADFAADKSFVNDFDGFDNRRNRTMGFSMFSNIREDSELDSYLDEGYDDYTDEENSLMELDNLMEDFLDGTLGNEERNWDRYSLAENSLFLNEGANETIFGKILPFFGRWKANLTDAAFTSQNINKLISELKATKSLGPAGYKKYCGAILRDYFRLIIGVAGTYAIVVVNVIPVLGQIAYVWCLNGLTEIEAVSLLEDNISIFKTAVKDMEEKRSKTKDPERKKYYTDAIAKANKEIAKAETKLRGYKTKDVEEAYDPFDMEDSLNMALFECGDTDLECGDIDSEDDDEFLIDSDDEDDDDESLEESLDFFF